MSSRSVISYRVKPATAMLRARRLMVTTLRTLLTMRVARLQCFM
ncbi:hypothetical protein SXCC_02052 [Gluconacetobacter sp. SXCC-1]|nr:hypothetical protein SXCC_02052 [Gluconacetobacter sp. SXCC-1]